ncbi:MAG: DNA-binding protein [Sedimenticola thiotaurini]|uniref:DNA-binding protein n=1 Tax=Sedimenticola thiotaurini TaxID=1543721 RepID=A0A558DGL8_9GAMM|nr:MAG: DNA-binding protein [Sedimenticola thiotaurini]
MAKNATLTIRISKELKEQLQKLANQDRRSLSDYIGLVLEEHAEGKG